MANSYIQYETQYKYIIVETDKLIHPTCVETVYRIRCGDDCKSVLNKKEIEPYIKETYGDIIKKTTIKY